MGIKVTMGRIQLLQDLPYKATEQDIIVLQAKQVLALSGNLFITQHTDGNGSSPKVLKVEIDFG